MYPFTQGHKLTDGRTSSLGQSTLFCEFRLKGDLQHTDYCVRVQSASMWPSDGSGCAVMNCRLFKRYMSYCGQQSTDTLHVQIRKNRLRAARSSAVDMELTPYHTNPYGVKKNTAANHLVCSITKLKPVLEYLHQLNDRPNRNLQCTFCSTISSFHLAGRHNKHCQKLSQH